MNQIHKQVGRVAALSEKFQSTARNYVKPSSLMPADFSDFKAGLIKEYDELLIEHDEVLHYFVTEEINNNIVFNFSIVDDRLNVFIDGARLTTLDGNVGYIRNTLKTLKDQFNIQVKDVDLFVTHNEHDGRQSIFKVPAVSTAAEAMYLTPDEILSNKVASTVSLPEIPHPDMVKTQAMRDLESRYTF